MDVIMKNKKEKDKAIILRCKLHINLVIFVNPLFLLEEVIVFHEFFC